MGVAGGARRRLAAGTATVLIAAAWAAPGLAADEPSVRRARARLEAVRVEAQAAAQGYVDALTALGRVEARIETLEHRIPRVEARISELRDVLARRAVELYQGADQRDFGVVARQVRAGSLLSGRRAAILVDAAQADTDAAADELETLREQLRADRAALGEARVRQRVLTELARVRTEELATAVQEADAALRRAEQQQALRRYYAAIAAQRAAQEAALAAAEQEEAPPPPEPQAQRPPAPASYAAEIPVASLRCPVAGTVTFVDDWGQPRSGWRVHQGTDIFTAAGTPNVAVAAGVARPRVGGLGGNAIWLHTDDGHAYYYAHLDRFEGAFDGPDGTRRVEQGEVLGYAGNTGNAAGGPVHTHFEIHPRNAGPINPFPLLRDMCAAELGTATP
jgi:murein DD-endopeptidase MepM/ murein hydrolase activator NlpD